MYYYSKTSKNKIIHTDACRYRHAISQNHMGSFEILAEAHEAGYRLCKACSPLVKMFRDEEEKLMVLCREKGLAISLRRNFITISSPRSKWRILADDNRNRTMLYHCNDFDYENASPVPGYHNQHVNYATLQEYLDYIIDHDYYRMMHPLYPAPQPKAPPVKGTKRYRKAQAKEKRKAKKAAVWNVLNIIDSLSAQNQTRAVV